MSLSPFYPFSVVPGNGQHAGLTVASIDDSGNAAFAGTVNATGGITNTQVSQPSQINVITAGAKGDGVTNDTAAIQAAINSLPLSGGVVYFPSGTYLISAALKIGNNTILMGSGINSTVIKQSSTTANGIQGTGLNRVTIRDLKVLGPGSGSGVGVFMSDNSGAAGNFYIQLNQLWVEAFGSHGVQTQTTCVSEFVGVVSKSNAGHGIFLDTNATGGTSTNLLNCYAPSNTQAGYYLKQQQYGTLAGCATDSCGAGYILDTCQATVLSGCGCEATVNNGGSYTGTAYKLTGGNTTSVVNCYNYHNLNTAVLVTGGQNNTDIIGFRENTPTGTATVSIQVDSGCSNIHLANNKFTTPQSLTTTAIQLTPHNAASPSNHGVLAWTGDPSTSTSGTTTTVAGTVYLAAIYINQSVAVTKLWYCVNAAGSGATANENQIGIYNQSGTLLASAVIDSTITSNGPQSGTISSTLLAAGWYWIGVVFNASGQPGIGRTSAALTSANSFNQSASSARWAVNGLLQTALPSSITPASNSQTGVSAFWAAAG